MSGTKEKTTGKQIAKGRAGAVSAQEVAPADAADLPRAERSVTLPGHYVAVGASPVSVTPGTVDVVVLEVRARHERGFWRCGRFWPREPVHVFVSDDPDGDNEANALEGDVVVECFVSHETAERLKAEPHLVVAVVPVLQVAEKD